MRRARRSQAPRDNAEAAAGTKSLHGNREDDDSPSLEDRLASSNRSPSEEAGGREVYDQVQDAIRMLPGKLQFPFIFCVVDGNSYAECAAVLGINRKTVENRIYRARQKLKLQLESLGI